MSHLNEDSAVLLRGTAQRVQFSTPTNEPEAYQFATDDFALEIWSRFEGPAAIFASKGGVDLDGNIVDPDGGFYVAYVGTALAFHLQSGNEIHRLINHEFNLSTGQWHHIACVRSSGELAVYVDGEPFEGEVIREGLGENEKTVFLKSSQPLVLGTPEGRKDEHHLEITQFRLWNETRTVSQVQGLMYHQLNREYAPDSLIGLWNFDDGQATDGSRLENHGEYVGGPAVARTELKLVPPGVPYMVVQTQFMQDYRRKSPSGLSSCEKFRAEELGGPFVTIRNLDGGHLGFRLNRDPQVFAPENRTDECILTLESLDGEEIAIKNRDGHYLGFKADHTPQTWVHRDCGEYERFTRVDQDGGYFSIRNKDGHYLGFLSEGSQGLVWGNGTPAGAHEVFIKSRLPGDYSSVDNRDKDHLGFRMDIGPFVDTRPRPLRLTKHHIGVAVLNEDNHFLGAKDGELWVSREPREYETFSRIPHEGRSGNTFTIRNIDGDLLGFKADETPHGQVWLGRDSEEFTSFRTVLRPMNENGTPYHDKDEFDCKVELWCDEPVSALVNGQPLSLPRSSSRAVKVRTNDDGQISVVIAAESELRAPAIRVRTKFMKPREHLKVSPDRHLHFTMANVTAKQLTGEADSNALMPQLTTNKRALLTGENAQYADAVSGVLRNLMGATTEHQSDTRHVIHELGNPQAAGDVGSVSSGSHRLPRGFLQHSDVSRAEPRPNDDKTKRFVDCFAMVDGHFSIDFRNNGKYEKLTDRQVRDWHAGLPGIEHGNQNALLYHQLSDPSDPHHPVIEFQTLQEFQNRYSSFVLQEDFLDIEFWDWIKEAAKIIVSTVTHVIHDIGKVVKTIKITVQKIVSGIEKAAHFIVHTVEEAVKKVHEILKKVVKSITKVIDFFRHLLDWDDILDVHEAISNYVNQGLLRMEGMVEGVKQRAHELFQGLEQRIDEHFDESKRHLAGKKPRQYHDRAPGGVRSNWLQCTFLDHVGDITIGGDLDRFDFGPITQRLESAIQGCEPIASKLQNFAEQNRNPGEFQISEIMRLFKDLLPLGIRIADDVVGIFLEVIEELIRTFREMITYRIQIPVITSLYEQVITKGRSELTVLDLVSLIVAAPATVMLKLFLGGSLSAGMQEAIAKMKSMTAAEMTWLGGGLFNPSNAPAGTIEASAQGELPEWWKHVSWVLGHFALFTQAFRNVLQILGPTSKHASPFVTAFLSTCALVCAWTLSCPMDRQFLATGIPKHPEIYIPDFVLWLARGCVFFVLGIFSMYIALQPSPIKEALTNVLWIIMTILGLILGFCSAVLGILAITLLIVRGENPTKITNWVLKSIQIPTGLLAPATRALLLVPKTEIKVIAMGLPLVTSAAVFGLGLTRLEITDPATSSILFDGDAGVC